MAQHDEDQQPAAPASNPNQEALARIKAAMAVPPQQRRDFNNPLEKIEELLTCSICLDRYRNPKLLPCQHTFCCEPCLDGCVDIVKRVLKCPECRAEHSIPYDGVKAFQTNLTIINFLEIHLQASEDNAAEIEAYIRRYNMERCKVCDEKAEVFYCTHCDKRICEDCKTSHMELIKKDLGRLMNQVKRLSTRVTDASDGLSKGMESLTLNCENTKEEIKDYVRRYSKELKRKEEKLIAEIDTFLTAEHRLMRNLRDALELESSNINEACARVDAYIKGERDIGEQDLVFYKNLFSDGLDYLRGFHPDADDLFSKKMRFSVGHDPNAVPAAILQFGDLQICSANFGGRWQSVEQTYLPKCFNLGLESDRYRVKTPNFDINDPTGAHQRLKDKDKHDKQSHSDNEASLRYRRRQQLEDEAWNRLRPDRADTRRSPGDARTPHHLSPTTSDSDLTHQQQGGAANDGSEASKHVQRSPFGQMNTQETAEAGSSSQAAPTADGSRHGSSALDSLMAQATAAVDRSKSPKSSSATNNRKPPMPPRPASSAEENALNERVESIRKEHERHAAQQQQQHARSSRQTHDDEEAVANGVDDNADHPGRHYPGGVTLTERQKERQQRELSGMAQQQQPMTGIRERAHSRGEASIQSSMDWKKYLIPEPSSAAARARGETPGASSSNYSAGRRGSPSGDDEWSERRRAFVRAKTNPEFANDLLVGRSSRLAAAAAEPSSPAASGSGYKSRYMQMQEQSGDRRYKYSSGARVNSGEDSSPEHELSSTAGGSKSASGSDRRSRYRRKASQQLYTEGGADRFEEEAISIPVEHYNTYRPSADREPPRFATQLSNAPVANATVGVETFRQPPRIDYKAKGKQLVKFGSKGSAEGEFNWPRGVAVTCDGDIAVCDSSNHRIQVFSRRGSLLRAFGRYGSGKAEFDCLAGVAATRFGQLVITDRYNHRIQVIEASTGSFVREFGQHGQTNGRFNNPWGVVVDHQGFIYVCDKDNHRVQIFQSDGNFVGKFGTIGNREGQFQNPHFIAVNKHNQLIVTDSSNHRVQVFDHNGHFLYTFGQEGYHDGQFKYPRGVTVDDQGYIIVADSGNNRIQVFCPDGRFYQAFCSYGSGDSQLKGVEAVTVDTDGRIIVSDRENHRVQIF